MITSFTQAGGGMQKTPPLLIKNLLHKYGNKIIFSSVNLELSQGECVVLLGKSGCGKSTLLRDVAGLSTPESGHIKIADQMVFDGSKKYSKPTEKRQVGMLFQDYALFPTMTVKQNIAFGLHNQSNQQQRVLELLKLTELESLANRYPHQLSGGQQQRTALARALAPRPNLILLDEPFANIDARLRNQLGNAIRRAITSEKVSAIMVTHDRNDAFSLADRIAVMGSTEKETTIVQADLPEQIYQQPRSLQVATLTGEVIELAGQANGSTCRTPVGNFSLVKPMQGPVILLVRPEQLEIQINNDGLLRASHCHFFGDRFKITGTYQDQMLHFHWQTSVAIGQHFDITNKSPLWALKRSKNN